MGRNKAMLKFFGKGSAFADDNTCAYFKDGKDMILIDFSLEAFPKFRKIDFDGTETIYILITHTHGDHISGIGTLIHYAYFILKLPVIIVSPTPEIMEHMTYLLDKMEGCHNGAYSIVLTENFHKHWFIDAIPTTHSETHAGNCFGYGLLVRNNLVVYTGDTNTLEPFIAFLKQKNTSCKYLYTEISAYNTGVHLYIEDNLDILLALQEQGVNIYVMHLDDEQKITSMIKGTDLKIVDTQP